MLDYEIIENIRGEYISIPNIIDSNGDNLNYELNLVLKTQQIYNNGCDLTTIQLYFLKKTAKILFGLLFVK
jgi:hypothetical protein